MTGSPRQKPRIPRFAVAKSSIEPGDGHSPFVDLAASGIITSHLVRRPFVDRNREALLSFDPATGILTDPKSLRFLNKNITDPYVYTGDNMRRGEQLIGAFDSMQDELKTELNAFAGSEDLDDPSMLDKWAQRPERDYYLYSMCRQVLEALNRFTIQRMVLPAVGAQLTPAPKGDLKRDMLIAARAVGKYLKSAHEKVKNTDARTGLSDLASPLDTVLGAPYFTGDEKHRIHFAYSCRGLFLADHEADSGLFPGYSRDVENRAIGSSIFAEIDPVLGASFMTVLRLGPRRKEQPLYQIRGGDAVEAYKLKNYPRTRLALASPSYLLPIYLPFYTVVKNARKASREAYDHFSPIENEWMNFMDEGPTLAFSVDGKAYDRNISGLVAREIFTILAEELDIRDPLVVRALRELHWMPAVFQDFTTLGQGTALNWRPGPDGTGLPSGIKITTEYGAAYMFVIISTALIRAGLATPDSIAATGPLNQRDVRILNQGDDTLILARTGPTIRKLADSYLETYADFGPEGESVVSSEFLAHCIIPRRLTGLPSAAVVNPVRYLQGMVSPEKGHTLPANFVASLLGRGDGFPEFEQALKALSGSNSRLADLTLRIVKGAYMAVGDLTDLGERAQIPWWPREKRMRGLSLLASELSSKPREFATLMEWVRDNAQSPLGASILAAYQEVGLYDADADAGPATAYWTRLLSEAGYFKRYGHLGVTY